MSWGAGSKRPAARAFPMESEGEAGDQHIYSLEVTPLGGGNEVGRSCLLLKYRGKTILLDCGILPSFTGQKALPYLSELNPADLDIIIITHFHLDHCAALPYITERMVGFKGRIFATYPTVAVMKMLLQDFIRVSSMEASEPEELYDESDIDKCLARIEAVDIHQRIDVDGVKMQFYNAGHVLGAAMVLIDIARVRILYTGDYSCEDDRHLMAAEIPRGVNIDCLIVEATHGMTTMESREVRERRFIESVETVLARGGRCLIPVFAIGRAQELMLILDELWESKPELQSIPLYHANRLASKALEVYRTFVNHMNSRIQTAMVGSAADIGEGSEPLRNPWLFKHIRHIRGQDDFKDTGPCVVLASPGMLQHGFSRFLFDKWCEDPRNGVVLAGYSTEGTLAKSLESNPLEVVSSSNRKMARRIGISKVSFSAHADATQTAGFIEALKPPAIILVHGEHTEMTRLHTHLRRKYQATPNFGAFMPANNSTVVLPYEDERVVRVLGRMAAKRIAAGMKISGVLVQKNFQYLLMEPADVAKHTEVSVHSIRQRQHVPYRSTFGLLKHVISAMFLDVKPLLVGSNGQPVKGNMPVEGSVAEWREVLQETRRALLVAGEVTVTHAPPDRVLVSWTASPVADMIADSLVAIISSAELSPVNLKAAVMLTSSGTCSHSGGDAPHSHGGERSSKRRALAIEEVEGTGGESEGTAHTHDGSGEAVYGSDDSRSGVSASAGAGGSEAKSALARVSHTSGQGSQIDHEEDEDTFGASPSDALNLIQTAVSGSFESSPLYSDVVQAVAVASTHSIDAAKKLYWLLSHLSASFGDASLSITRPHCGDDTFGEDVATQPLLVIAVDVTAPGSLHVVCARICLEAGGTGFIAVADESASGASRTLQQVLTTIVATTHRFGEPVVSYSNPISSSLH